MQGFSLQQTSLKVVDIYFGLLILFDLYSIFFKPATCYKNI